MELDKKTAAIVAKIRERLAVRKNNRVKNGYAPNPRKDKQPSAQDDLATLLDIVDRLL